MITLSQIEQKVRRTYFQYFYTRSARAVLNTAPLVPGTMPFTLLSMVHHRDLLPYLVAIKSFTYYANPSRIVVVCDPSVTDIDRSVLKSHIPHLDLRHADEFTHPDIPRGGTWERLYAISEYASNDYVVQIDADTVTMQSPTEVIEAINGQVSFVIGETSDQKLLTLDQMAIWSKRFQGDYDGIQSVVERSINKAGLTNTYYVRGCSGFTGFSASPDMRKNLLLFSNAMRAKHDGRWAEWGTEQITSNYLVANLPGTKILPFPQYGTPDVLNSSSIFVHFIGYLRFTTAKYEDATRQAIKQLSALRSRVSEHVADEFSAAKLNS